MFKRLFWLTVGVLAGFTLALWTIARLRRRAATYRPDRLAHEVGGAVRSVRANVRAAVVEGRTAMAEREDELRAEYDPDGRNAPVAGRRGPTEDATPAPASTHGRGRHGRRGPRGFADRVPRQ